GVLDAGATGVLDADDRAADLDGHLHDLDDLAAEGLADGTAVDGLVVGVDAHRAAVDTPVAGDDTVGVDGVRDAGGLGQGADLNEGAFVGMRGEALSRGRLTGLVAFGAGTFGARIAGPFEARPQIRNFVGGGRVSHRSLQFINSLGHVRT